MRAVMTQIPEHWLEERTRLGQDRRDELWNGALHRVPPPGFVHQDIAGEIVGLMRPSLRRLRIAVVQETGVYRPGSNRRDYRVPDVLFVSRDSPALHNFGVEGAPLAVVEIRSPDDESYEKLPFYASLGVGEVIVISPDTRVTEVFRLDGETYRAVDAIDGRVRAESIDVVFATAPGPRLRIEHGGEAVEI